MGTFKNHTVKMNARNLQLEFETLVKKTNQPTTSESLKLVALALWYQDFVPSVDSFNGQDVGLAGYILDRLTRYNCLNSEKNHTFELIYFQS